MNHRISGVMRKPPGVSEAAASVYHLNPLNSANGTSRRRACRSCRRCNTYRHHPARPPPARSADRSRLRPRALLLRTAPAAFCLPKLPAGRCFQVENGDIICQCTDVGPAPKGTGGSTSSPPKHVATGGVLIFSRALAGGTPSHADRRVPDSPIASSASGKNVAGGTAAMP